MPIALFVGVVCAVLFFRAADHERMSPWAWSVVSLGLTAILTFRGAGVRLLLLGQAALFGLMWWYNMRRQNRKRV